MLMSDLTHRSLACNAHLNMLIENALYKFITITITIKCKERRCKCAVATITAFFLEINVLYLEKIEEIPAAKLQEFVIKFVLGVRKKNGGK